MFVVDENKENIILHMANSFMLYDLCAENCVHQLGSITCFNGG